MTLTRRSPLDLQRARRPVFSLLTVPAVLLITAAIAAACGSGPPGALSAAASDTTLDSVSTSSSSSSSSSTSTAAVTSTTAGAPSSSGSEVSVNDADPDWSIEVLGSAMIGTGEYVRLTGPSSAANADGPAGDTACELGWLGIRTDDQIHRYEELGELGNIRLFNGPRGQDALVVSCEGLTERVFVQGSAVLPDDGVPRFTEFEIGQPHLMDADADFGWRGDIFGGYGWHAGWDELVYFDTGSGFVTEAVELLGDRIDRLDSGFDVILPDGWEMATEDGVFGRVTLSPSDGRSFVTIDPVGLAGDPEFPEDAELVDFWSDDTYIWSYVSADRAMIIGTQERANWRLDHNDGTLVVQHIEAGEIDLIVRYYVADTEIRVWELAQLVTDQIRHYLSIAAD